MAAALSLAGVNRVVAQPAWYQHPEQRYPLSQYRIGLGSSSASDRAQRLDLARQSARADLVLAIRSRVVAAFAGITQERAGKVDQQISSQVTATASLEVAGIEVAEQTDEHGTAYALATLAIGPARQLHSDKLARLNGELAAGLPAAEALARQGQTAAALAAYDRLLALVAQRRDVEAVLLALGNGAETAFAELDRTDTSPAITAEQLRATIDQLTRSSLHSTEDAAAVLAYRLAQQLPAGTSVLVLPFTYGETAFTSAWSTYLARTLSAQLVANGLRCPAPTGRFTPRSADHTADLAQQAGASVVVRGPYEVVGGRVRVTALAAAVASDRKQAAVEVTLDSSAVATSGLDCRPRNWQQAQQDAGLFARGELIGGGLRVEAWTSRGAENLALEEGEHVTLVVRANQPCYLQMVYHLADGKRALLYGSYFLDAGKVNAAVELPDSFAVAAPFGVEVLQVTACTDPFPPMRTQEWQGYQILDDNLGNYISTVRGLKKVTPQRQMAETRLTLTTLARSVPPGAGRQ
jgi:hypothetical protein